jgi:hypothetical protein
MLSICKLQSQIWLGKSNFYVFNGDEEGWRSTTDIILTWRINDRYSFSKSKEEVPDMISKIGFWKNIGARHKFKV